MTLDQILMLKAVVKEGGFGKAAKSLNISQPSVSNGVRKIEEEFGITLFSREEYRPKLSKEGLSFLNQAERVLEEFSSLEDMGRLLSQKHEPIISIAINDACPMPLVLELLREFFSHHNKTQLKLHFEGVRGSTEKLVAGEVDFGITPVSANDLSLDSLSLGKYQLIPVCAPNFPGLRLEKPLSEKDLRPFTQVIVRDTSTQQPELDFGVIKGLRSSCTVNDNHTKREIILSGLGWGRLPNHMIEEDLKSGRLIDISSEDIKVAPIHIKLARVKKDHYGPVASSLWEHFNHMRS